MNSLSLKRSAFGVVFLLLIADLSYGQTSQNQKQGYFYLGFNAPIFTIGSRTTIKRMVSIKAGYNRRLNNNLYLGPAAQASLIKSPAHRFKSVTFLIGPNADYDFRKNNLPNNLPLRSYFSSNLIWLFPLNPKSTEHIYGDCLSLSASINNDDISDLKKSGVELTFDFQRHDTGITNGISRMVNVSTGTRIGF